MTTPAEATGAATPGPWMVLGDGVTVAQAKSKYRTHVCRAFEIYGIRSEREANARLIASAPDLRDALAELLAANEDDVLDDVEHPLHAAALDRAVEAVRTARAALRSTEGARNG